MISSALCEIIDKLMYDSGLSEAEAVCLVGRLLEEIYPGCVDATEVETNNQQTKFRA